MTSHGGDSKKAVSAFWDGSREYYEQAEGANLEITPERSVLLGYLKPGDLLLDLGSGSCENALWVPDGTRYVGTDVSTTALVMAGEKNRPAERVRSDGEQLPFADGTFDALLSTFALEHFHDPGATLLESVRVVRPGGLLLLVGSAWDLPYEMPPSLDPGRRLEVAAKRLGRQLLAGVSRKHRFRFDVVEEPRVLTDGYVPDADAVHVAWSWQMARFLEAAGCEIVEHRTLYHNPEPVGGLRGVVRKVLKAVPLWRHGWGNTLLVARRGAKAGVADYFLQPL